MSAPVNCATARSMAAGSAKPAAEAGMATVHIAAAAPANIARMEHPFSAMSVLCAYLQALCHLFRSTIVRERGDESRALALLEDNPRAMARCSRLGGQVQRPARGSLGLAHAISRNDCQALARVGRLLGKPFAERRGAFAGDVDSQWLPLGRHDRLRVLVVAGLQTRDADDEQDQRQVGQRGLPPPGDARRHAALWAGTESGWHEPWIAPESQSMMSSRARSSASALRDTTAASGAKTKLAITRP